MAADTTVRARINGEVKDEAAQVLNAMGLTVSDAIRIMLMRVAREKALPFDVKIPNAETRAAMEELESGKARRVDSVEALFADLKASD